MIQLAINILIIIDSVRFEMVGLAATSRLVLMLCQRCKMLLCGVEHQFLLRIWLACWMKTS